MQIHRNFTERIEEAYDSHYVCFVDRTHSPVKAAKNSIASPFQQDQLGKFFEAPG